MGSMLWREMSKQSLIFIIFFVSFLDARFLCWQLSDHHQHHVMLCLEGFGGYVPSHPLFLCCLGHSCHVWIVKPLYFVPFCVLSFLSAGHSSFLLSSVVSLSLFLSHGWKKCFLFSNFVDRRLNCLCFPCIVWFLFVSMQCRVLFRNHISVAFNFFCICFEIFQTSHPYIEKVLYLASQDSFIFFFFYWRCDLSLRLFSYSSSLFFDWAVWNPIVMLVFLPSLLIEAPRCASNLA